MFFDQLDIADKAPVDVFLNEYVKQTQAPQPEFESQINLYRARTNLSILAYLTKVGMGDSERFWSTLVAAERCLADVVYYRNPFRPASNPA